MAEYFTDSSDDDDSGSSSERSSNPPPPRIPAGSLGGFALGHNAAEKPHEPTEKPQQNIWERVGSKPDESPLFAALHHAEQERLKSDETDDDDEEQDEKSSEKSEAEAPVEELSSEEQKEVLFDRVASRKQELAAEQENMPADDLETPAVVQLYDRLEEELADPAISAEEALEKAPQDTAEAIAASDQESQDENPEEIPDAEAAESIETNPGDLGNEEEEEPDLAPGTVPPISTSGGSGGSTPPPPPTGPTGGPGATGGMPPPPPSGSPAPFFGGGGFNAPPTPTVTPNTAPDPNALSPQDLYYAERRGQIRGVVAGGIVGYLLGRRRGRIKTEKRLLPVQEKLEEQVEALHERVTDKELEIRKLAREKAASAELADRQAMAERLRSRTSVAHADVPQAFAAFTTEQAMPVTAEMIPEALRKPEAPVPEKHLENVQHMTHQELLKTGEKVIIDGTSLRTIYEAKQITESGLRHILVEFLSGGDIKRALDQELLVKQLTYERDPRVRDSLSAGYTTAASGSSSGSASSAVPEQMSNAQGQEAMLAAAAILAPNRAHEQSDIPDASLSSARRLERIIISGWIVFVAVLLLVIVLLLKHKGSL